MINRVHRRRLAAAILLIPITVACTSNPIPRSELITQATTLEDVRECHYLGYTRAGITEKNAAVTKNADRFEIDKNLLAKVRNLADETGADTIVPIRRDNSRIQEFRLYICNAE